MERLREQATFRPQPLLLPVLATVGIILSAWVITLGSPRTEGNVDFHGAEQVAPKAALTQQVMADEAAGKPQTRAEVVVERKEQAVEAKVVERKEAAEEAGSQAAQYGDFRAQFPALQPKGD